MHGATTNACSPSPRILPSWQEEKSFLDWFFAGTLKDNVGDGAGYEVGPRTASRGLHSSTFQLILSALYLVHFSAHFERFVWDRGCA